MRNLANLVFVGCLLALPACAFGQNADPFGGGANIDPFGPGASSDPFGGGRSKPPSVRPLNVQQVAQQVAQQKAVAAKAARKVKSNPTQESSDAIPRIRAALRDETTQTFVELPLQDAIQQLSRTHNIPIVIDRRAMEDVGLTPDTPVSLDLKNVSLRSFFRLMLRELDLTYVVRDEVMQITTIEAAEQNLVVEMYKFPEKLIDKADKVVMALTSSVTPDAWEVLGGPCTVTAIDDVLIVSANESLHEDVIDFLKKLHQAFENQKKPKANVSTIGASP